MGPVLEGCGVEEVCFFSRQEVATPHFSRTCRTVFGDVYPITILVLHDKVTGQIVRNPETPSLINRRPQRMWGPEGLLAGA